MKALLIPVFVLFLFNLNAQSKDKNDSTSFFNPDTISVQNSTKSPPQEGFNSFEILSDFQYEDNPIAIRPIDYGSLLVDHPKKEILAKLKVKSDSLDTYIKSLRALLDSFPHDNYTEVSKIMIEEKQANTLKKKLVSYKKFITCHFTDYFSENQTDAILNTDLPENSYSNSWEEYNFHQTIRVAAQLMLDKIRYEVHEVERIIVKNMNPTEE
ncbi:MAG: hypothetical protein K9H84_02075 [Bacteroidales bacterium]|nr:hypothetical protein [Bacteroidales bacterium]